MSYEIEVRAKVDEEFCSRLIRDGARVIKECAYQDDFWKPKMSEWDPEFITMRIRKREGESGVEVLFSRVQYVGRGGLRVKRSLYPEGKIRLFYGKEETAKKLLQDCGFVHWFSVKKLQCMVLEWKGIELAVENVEDFGWTLELEGEGAEPEKAIADIWEKLGKLGIKENQLISKSLPKIIAGKKGLVNLS